MKRNAIGCIVLSSLALAGCKKEPAAPVPTPRATTSSVATAQPGDLGHLTAAKKLSRERNPANLRLIGQAIQMYAQQRRGDLTTMPGTRPGTTQPI